MEQLVGAEPEDREDVGIDLRDRTAGELLDEVIEAALPPERTGDDLGGERAVALVGQVRAAPRQTIGAMNGLSRPR
jgi:hypothetical protein